MPQFAPGGTAGNGGQGTGGHATVNLHGLGSNRNLVLLDGRRLPLADISGKVDINLIPESILASVQTITGGASAVYGSDAMSGVVNFITLRHFEGVRIDAPVRQLGARGSTANHVLGGLRHHFAGDKGHALLSLGYSHREGLAGGKRDFFDLVTPSSFIGQGTFVPSATNLPNQAAVNSLFASYGAATPVSNTLNLGFNDNGTLFTQTGAKNYTGPTTDGYAIIAGNVRMPVGPQTVIQNPLDRKSVLHEVRLRVHAGRHAYGQILYVDSDVFTSSGGSLTQFGTLTTIPVTNPFIPNDLRTLLASRPNADGAFHLEWPLRRHSRQSPGMSSTHRAVPGRRVRRPAHRGTGRGIVYAAYDTTDHLQSNYNAVLKSQVQNLLNAPDGGASICAGGFNPFGVANSTRISPRVART